MWVRLGMVVSKLEKGFISKQKPKMKFYEDKKYRVRRKTNTAFGKILTKNKNTNLYGKRVNDVTRAKKQELYLKMKTV